LFRRKHIPVLPLYSPDMAHKTATVGIDGLRAYVAQPEQQGSAGVLVLPTIQGIEEHIEAICGWLNDAGLTALAWDPFSAFDANLPVQERWPIGRDQLDDRVGQREQLRWVRYMHEELTLANIGVLGFCLGGRMALTLCAAEPGLKACAAYHPSIEAHHPPRHLDAIAAAKKITCPVQVLYPGRDHVTTRATFEALREALESRSQPTTVQVYPDADHGFTEGFNIISGTDRAANPANVTAKALGWPQTAAFFNACLG
jgi:carboxymethylenebutenolidase